MSCLTLGCPPPRDSTRRSHCGSCHETFSSVSAFDRHQTLDSGPRCHDPAARGLVQRPDGVWRHPGENPNASITHQGNDRDGRTGGCVVNGTDPARHDALEAAQ